MKILVADDSRLNLAFISAILKDKDHEIITTRSAEEAIQLFQQARPDLVILDVVMTGMDGYECAKKIRAFDNNDWVPIIFLSASGDEVSIAKGIDAGGDDYLTKPFTEITLTAKVRAMQRIADMRKTLFDLSQQLRILSETDPLTGLYNRLFFDKIMKKKIDEAYQTNSLVALLFIDLDKFKPVNDTFGHYMGDMLLKMVSKRLSSCHRQGDFIARLGGDEFAIILCNLPAPAAAGDVAQKILTLLSEDFVLGNHKIIIGVSIGIALYPMMGTTAEELIKNADAAMYYVKESGRHNYKYFSEQVLP